VSIAEEEPMMSAHRFVALLVGALLTFASAHVSAQPPAQPDPAVWRSLLERLTPAAFVSVRLEDGTRFKGTVVAVGENDFTIQPRTRIPVALRTVRYEELASLEPEKRPMSAGRKVVTGVGIGFATYLVLVAIALSNWD
jgi:hypothetical protein